MKLLRGSGILLAAGLAWGGAALVAPHAEADRERQEELMYFPSGKMLQQAALGYHQAVAAVAWLRTVQYYGEHARSDLTFDMMHHLCNVVTDLDPKFEEPYLFGSFVLLTDAKRPREGLALLRKGLEKNPESWTLHFELGFVHYVALKEYETASRYFRLAAALPGAPEYAARFAAFVAMRAGELETSILLWKELAGRTTNPELRKKAEEKVIELEVELRSRPGPGS